MRQGQGIVAITVGEYAIRHVYDAIGNLAVCG